MNDATTLAPPIAVQLTVSIEALVHPETDVGGYSAEVPALPGCYTDGETLDEIRANLREAAEAWLASAHAAALRKSNIEIPVS